jgi:hypothetical protein
LREKERSLKITQQIHELRDLLSMGGVIVPKVSSWNKGDGGDGVEELSFVIMHVFIAHHFNFILLNIAGDQEYHPYRGFQLHTTTPAASVSP